MSALETMNGFTVTAERPTQYGDRVILAVRPDGERFEYVTARCRPRAEAPREWYWGHYSHDLDQAVRDFNER